MHFWVAAAASDARAAIYGGADPIMLRGGPNSTAACTPPPQSSLYGRWIAVAQACEPPLQMLVGPSLAETKRQGPQLTQAAAKRRDLQVDKVENQQWSWIAVAQASQLPQVVPQDVARPFASLGLPQVVPGSGAGWALRRCNLSRRIPAAAGVSSPPALARRFERRLNKNNNNNKAMKRL